MHALKTTFLLLIFNTLFTSIAPLGQAQEQPLEADVLFAPNQIVDVQIEIPEESWNQLRSQSRSFVDSLRLELADSPFTNFKADITINGVKIKDVGIRKKGFLGSLNNERPSLKVKFDEYIDQDPIKGLDRLTLNNNNQDAGRMCQYMSYRMYNKSGTKAPRCSFAKVTVNGKNLGIYSNVEAVRKPFLKAGFDSGKGNLFEGTVTDFYDRWVPRFEAKTKKSDPAVITQITKLLDEKEIDLKQLEQRIDIPAFMKFWAMESLIGFWDGYCNNQNNYFIYQNPKNEKVYFIPWGVDSSYAKTMPLPPYRVRPRSVHSKAILPNKLYRIPETQAMYQKALFGLLEEFWNEEELVAEIDQLEALLEDEILPSNRGFRRGVRNYRRFVETRREEVMEEFEDGPPELNSGHQLPVFFEEVGQVDVKFATQWYKRRPKDATLESDLEIQYRENGELIELEDTGVYAEPNRSPQSKNETTIIVFGTRKSDGKKLTFAASMPNERFKSGIGKTQEVNGLFMVDNNFMANGRWTMLGGSAKLDEANMEDGQPVSGSMDLKILRLTDGKPSEKQP